MTQTASPHPDYESLQNVVSSVVQRCRSYREAQKTKKQFRNCSPDDMAAMARDLRMSPGELVAVAGRGQNAANLLQKLLIALGINPGKLLRNEPAIMRDLQRLCITCASKQQCEFDLLNDKAIDKFRDYCPNAFTLDALLKAKQ